MVKKYQKYDRLFKEQAVLKSYKRKTLKEAAAEIGIRPCILTRWRQEYQRFGAGSFCGSGYARVHPDERLLFDLKKQCRESELRLEILKEGTPYLFQDQLKIYGFIKSREKKYPLTKMCRVLDIGVGRYLRWKKNGLSKKKQELLSLKKDITTIFLHHKKLHGRNKIAQELHSLGYKITDRQVSFYMKQLGLRSMRKRKFKKTTDSRHNYLVSDNILNGSFKTDSPSKVWVSDITYIQANKGFMYLTVVIDLFDRKIIGWSCSNRMFAKTTSLAAWEMAVIRRTPKEGLIFHSDRGVQYANKAFTSILDSYGCTRSMSRKGTHWDNAVAESFFSILKKELIHRVKLLSHKQLNVEISDFIENWYNRDRRHSFLNYKTIPEFNALNESIISMSFQNQIQ